MFNKFRILNGAGEDITATLTIPEGSHVVAEATKAESIDLSPGRQLYARANDENITLSQLLERLDPSEDGAKLDAYGRQLRRFGIVPKSVPSKGIFCSMGERFFQSGNPDSAVLFPEFISRTARMALIAPSMVDEMVGSVRPIVGDTYKDVEITWEQKNVKKVRVTQGSDFPEVTISWADAASTVYKYGRQIKATYEFVRRCSLDLISTAINLIMVESRAAEADDAVKTLINGIAAGYIYLANGTTGLDPTQAAAATERNLSFTAWIKFAMRFSPYKCNVIVANENAMVKFITMTKPGADPFEILAALREGPSTINIRLAQSFWGPVTLIYNSTVRDWDLIAFQKEYAMERIVEIGADLAETDRLINTQFHRIVVSECQNFGKVFPQCIRILRLN
jgi:hypothetical protein